MLLGLSKIIDSPGASVSFSTTVDLSDLCYGVSYPVSEPVAAEGTVRNTAGVLVMTGADLHLHPRHLRPMRQRF